MPAVRWPVLLLSLALPLAAQRAPAAAQRTPALAQEGPAVELQCRVGGGAWQPCRMQVESLGERWWLIVADQRFGFRHDGRGGVTMQAGSSAWRPVDARWQNDASLCWNGVCARGDIPLD